MPKSVLTRKRSLIARIAIFAMIFSLMAVALPASAHSVAIDATGPCPAMVLVKHQRPWATRCG